MGSWYEVQDEVTVHGVQVGVKIRVYVEDFTLRVAEHEIVSLSEPAIECDCEHCETLDAHPLTWSEAARHARVPIETLRSDAAHEAAHRYEMDLHERYENRGLDEDDFT